MRQVWLARRLLATGATAALVALFAHAAAAGVTPWAGMRTDVQTACEDQPVVHPFLPWLDLGAYVFAPDGGLEQGAVGWQLRGAAVVGGNEPWAIHDGRDRQSLALPEGASAVTPASCLGLVYPFARAFVSGPWGGALEVELLYVDAFGQPRAATLGVLDGTGRWRLSPQLLMASPLVSLLSRLQWAPSLGVVYSAVAFRFTALEGSWRLDDLYVDPFKFS